MSPEHALGRRFRREPQPFAAMMYRFLAPVLSAQLIVAATGRPRVTSPAKISAALEEFRADEEAMKAQFMAAL